MAGVIFSSLSIGDGGDTRPFPVGITGAITIGFFGGTMSTAGVMLVTVEEQGMELFCGEVWCILIIGRDRRLKLKTGGPGVHVLGGATLEAQGVVMRGAATIKSERERELSGPVSSKAMETRRKKLCTSG